MAAPITSPGITSAAQTGRAPSQALGQKEFLNLLAAQMSHQDPMNPMKDTDFIAQLAQFTSLEQAKSTSQNMATLQATSLIGKEVTVKGNVAGETFFGEVTGVEIKDDAPRIFLDDSTESIAMSRLLSIKPAAVAAPAPAQAATTPQTPATASWIPQKLANILNP